MEDKEVKTMSVQEMFLGTSAERKRKSKTLGLREGVKKKKKKPEKEIQVRLNAKLNKPGIKMLPRERKTKTKTKTNEFSQQQVPSRGKKDRKNRRRSFNISGEIDFRQGNNFDKRNGDMMNLHA